MNQVQAFLYGRHALRKIPSGQRDSGNYEGRHRCICPEGAVHAWCSTHGQPDDGYPGQVAVNP